MEEAINNKLIRLGRVVSILNRDDSFSLIKAILLSFTGSVSIYGLPDIPKDVQKALVESLPSFYLTKIRLEGKPLIFTNFEKDLSVNRKDLIELIERAVVLLPNVKDIIDV